MSIIKYVILFVTCILIHYSYVPDPDNQAELEISNSTFVKVNDEPNNNKYAIKFCYSVMSMPCKIGSYSLRYNSGKRGAHVDWYKMKTIMPGFTYTITDIFRLSDSEMENPIVFI